MGFHHVFLVFMGLVYLCTANENPHLRRRSMQPRSYRSSAEPQTSHAEMMSQLNDRVSALATLDQAQRDKLDNIEKKLEQINSTTVERLDAISAQQHLSSNMMENLEKTQRNAEIILREIRNDLDALRYSATEKEESGESKVLHTRQATLTNDTDNTSQTMDGLAWYLAASIRRIETSIHDINKGLARLTQLSRRGTHKRVSNLFDRNQYGLGSFGYPHPQAYGPPPPPPSLAASTFGQYPLSCAQASLAESGIQKIQVDPQTEPFYVYCDSTEKGGWTVIQKRIDGSISFQREWEQYKLGFGNLAGEFFIGLDKLHAITDAALQELLIVMTDFKNETRFALYDAFAVGGEREFYPLQVLGKYRGDAGDSLSYQAGNKFSTFDHDNDGWVEGNCAQAHTGAWWYGACELSNLNGQYLQKDLELNRQYQGIYWADFNGPLSSLKSVQMKVRPKESKDVF